MIKFSSSTLDDVQQLSDWIAADPYHKEQGRPEWWLTGNGLLAFCLMDAEGPLTYVRLDTEGEYVRIHTQFAPEDVVSKRRLVVGMVKCMERLISLYNVPWTDPAQPPKKGMIFNSISPSLIAFMSSRFQFKSVGNDDYRLDFEV